MYLDDEERKELLLRNVDNFFTYNMRPNAWDKTNPDSCLYKSYNDQEVERRVWLKDHTREYVKWWYKNRKSDKYYKMLQEEELGV
jgi:hypothetical protein